MSVTFNKDLFITDAIMKKYLIVQQDGQIFRAKKSTCKGVVYPVHGYVPVHIQTHKKTGRIYFNMSWRGMRKSVLLNRVVALRYLPNPDKLPMVNHIDGDKTNNHLSNLEWSSQSSNEGHARRTGLKSNLGSSNSNAKLTAEDVAYIRSCAGCSMRELADKFNVKVSTIMDVVSRKSWGHV